MERCLRRRAVRALPIPVGTREVVGSTAVNFVTVEIFIVINTYEYLALCLEWLYKENKPYQFRYKFDL